MYYFKWNFPYVLTNPFKSNPVRGHAQMTSAERGREGGTQILTVGGGGCVISIVKILTRGGEGVKNPENLADVICERLLSVPSPAVRASVPSRKSHRAIRPLYGFVAVSFFAPRSLSPLMDPESKWSLMCHGPSYLPPCPGKSRSELNDCHS